MSVSNFGSLSSAINEGSRQGTTIFASALLDLTHRTSSEFGNHFTIGTRKVFQSTNDVWCSGGELFGSSLSPEIQRLTAEYFALQKSTLEERWGKMQRRLSSALESCLKTFDFLQNNSSEETASYFVSMYKAYTEEAFLSLLRKSLHASTQSLLHILRVKASLIDHQSERIEFTPKANKLEFQMSKHLADRIEEGLTESYHLLEEAVEAAARRTLRLLHTTYLAGQATLCEKLQEGIREGLKQATFTITSALSHHFLTIHHRQITTLEAFASSLANQLGSLLATSAQTLATAQRKIFEEIAAELALAQAQMVKSDVVRLMKDHKDRVNSETVPILLTTLEGDILQDVF